MEEEKKEGTIARFGDEPGLTEPERTAAGTMPWYYRTWAIAFAILGFGPLGLLLLWFRPRTKIAVKILVSVLVFALTVWITVGAVDFYREMVLYYEELAKVVEGA
ncbi:MAG: hypothetical protein U9R44_02300 [Candidatus Omnitrophota bacterium]|nr:hypothetical protein [Candidatus Omnitrophota bacterium]